MKKYKVVSQNDSVFSGKFSPEILEKVLNQYAKEGWKLVDTVRSQFPSILGGAREAVALIFEKDEDQIDSRTLIVDYTSKSEESLAVSKTEFDVVLNTYGNNLIKVIQVVREATGLGLAAAKNLTLTKDAVIKEGIQKEEAEVLKVQLENAGATVELK
jgi:large subunit ribosomal protein L7/L12